MRQFPNNALLLHKKKKNALNTPLWVYNVTLGIPLKIQDL